MCVYLFIFLFLLFIACMCVCINLSFLRWIKMYIFARGLCPNKSPQRVRCKLPIKRGHPIERGNLGVESSQNCSLWGNRSHNQVGWCRTWSVKRLARISVSIVTLSVVRRSTARGRWAQWRLAWIGVALNWNPTTTSPWLPWWQHRCCRASRELCLNYLFIFLNPPLCGNWKIRNPTTTSPCRLSSVLGG